MTYHSRALDTIFQALADPTRRAIVDRLTRSPASVTQLASPFRMALPTVMQHIQLLENSGLLVSEKVGRVRTCRINTETLGIAEDWIAARRELWERRLDLFGEHLEGLGPDNRERKE